MKKQLPDAFIAWLIRHMKSNSYKSVKRLHRGLIMRLALWRDGINENAIPGYATPPPDGAADYPAGWSIQSFRKIARECEADIDLSIRPGFRALDFK